MCAGLKLPIGLVPVTLQTFVVLLSGILLGSKRGAVAQIAYVSAGVAGVPWFSSGGGWQYIFSPTFGYLLGFIFAAYVVGLLAERGLDRKIITSIAAMIIGNMCIYFFGLLWLSKFIPQGHLLSIGLYPFIIGDALKILAAGILLPFVWKFLIIENKTNGF
jgi:biotin transport system substrate-specific component